MNGSHDLRPLRQLLAGGDVLSVPHVAKALRELKNTRLINGYGPTESTTFACCHAIWRERAARSCDPDREADREHDCLHPRRRISNRFLRRDAANCVSAVMASHGAIGEAKN